MSLVRFVLLVWVIIEILFAYFSFIHWKGLYYCPEYHLFIYSDNGIVGNKSMLLGQDLSEMNTLIRFDYTRDDNSCYILKGEEGFLIYWPEDTTSYHWDYVRDTLKNKYNLQKVPYQKRLKKMECQDGLFQLITYKHQTKENWKENFESWTDAYHWDNADNAIVIDHVLCPVLTGWKSGERIAAKKISGLEYGVTTYMKLYWKALDKKTSGLFVAKILGLCLLIWLTYRMTYWISRLKRTHSKGLK